MAVPAIGVFEIVRLVLYGLEFISGIVVFGVTSDDLYGTAYGYGTVCVFRSSGSPGVCRAIIALGVLLWLALIALAVLHCLKYLGRGELPYLVEGIAFSVMALLWFVVAILVSIDTPPFKPDEMRAVQCFAWLNVFFHIGSAVIAFLSTRAKDADNDSDNDTSPAPPVYEAPSYNQTETSVPMNAPPPPPPTADVPPPPPPPPPQTA